MQTPNGRWFCAACAINVVVACGPPAVTGQTELNRQIDAAQSHNIQSALAHPDRPVDDRQQDDDRAASAVLGLIGIESGDQVFEIEAGRGYYTELFSRLVGPAGSVVMQSPLNFDSFLSAHIEKRLADDRLPNVRLSKTPFDALDADTGTIDVVTWILGPHELFFDPSNGASLGDEEKAFAEIYRILTPGGALLVIDHYAEEGAPASSGDTLHRIDPAIVKVLAQSAGLRLTLESDVLRNETDDHTVTVFDSSVRGRTDKFVQIYKKPSR